ncbi:MAG TPA: Mur ligase family protein [Xanthomonadales bacterium]|nr:Mur ligase family protein [Xanthomonadales bacterium]
MISIPLILFGKLLSKLTRFFNLGDGSTWPGHIALSAKPNFIKEVLQSNPNIKVIIIAGTNGKTTTAALIASSLKNNGKTVIQNQSGANLLNGIASTLILRCNRQGKLKQDFAIFEIDENNLTLILQQIKPDYLILLNLFRDQLDRYGEVNIVASNWTESIRSLTNKTTMILNADDPQIAFLAKNTKAYTKYFGCSDVSIHHYTKAQAADSDHCPECGTQLAYRQIFFSHLGDWHCTNCGLKRPKLDMGKFPVYPLPGTYNKYNTHAAVLTLREIGIGEHDIENSFQDFKPAFGRQEIVNYKGKNVQIFLSKNPTSLNQSFQAISELGGNTVLFVLNDRIPDGRDISWIWDVDFPNIQSFKNILVAGDRVYDMALRLKYENIDNFQTFASLEEAVNRGVNLIEKNETLFILPTYSAMLDTRKILTGKKIL